MQIINNPQVFSHLSEIQNIFDTHQMTQKSPRGYTRLRNYLKAIAEWANGETNFNEISFNMDMSKNDFLPYQKKFPGMPDIQACLIYMIGDAASQDSHLGNYLTSNQQEFIFDLHLLLQGIEQYLPEDTVNNLYKNFYKGLIVKTVQPMKEIEEFNPRPKW